MLLFVREYVHCATAKNAFRTIKPRIAQVQGMVVCDTNGSHMSQPTESINSPLNAHR